MHKSYLLELSYTGYTEIASELERNSLARFLWRACDIHEQATAFHYCVPLRLTRASPHHCSITRDTKCVRTYVTHRCVGCALNRFPVYTYARTRAKVNDAGMNFNCRYPSPTLQSTTPLVRLPYNCRAVARPYTGRDSLPLHGVYGMIMITVIATVV